MIGFVITLLDDPRSVAVARRCVESGSRFGFEIETFPAVDRKSAEDERVKEGLRISYIDRSMSDAGAVIGNFISQFRIWKIIAAADSPAIICEHDALFTAPLPQGTEFEHLLSVGKPSFGGYASKPSPGVYPLFSKKGYLPGAHGYIVKPSGAAMLVAKAMEKGIQPCDIFLGTTNFPWVQELQPWIVEAHDTFSTIQKRRGCMAKHNFKDGYEFIE
jgi:hypothetical protein